MHEGQHRLGCGDRGIDDEVHVVGTLLQGLLSVPCVQDCTLVPLCQDLAQGDRCSMRESISISLPADLKDELDQATAADGISRSDLVREALRTYLFARRFRALRYAMLPYAEARGVFTDEDVFNLVS